MLFEVLIALACVLAVYFIRIVIAVLMRKNEFQRLNPSMETGYVLIGFGNMVRFLRLPWLSPLGRWMFTKKYSNFDGRKVKEFFATMEPDIGSVFLSDPILSREALVHRKELLKPVQFYEIIETFGPSVLSTEGDDFRRHKKIVAPAFSERNNMTVHEATIRIAESMFASWESNGASKFKVRVCDDMMKLALSVISSAAFGKDIPWNDDDTSALENGHVLSFKNALELVVERTGLWVGLPRFIFSLPFKFLKETKKAFEEFDQYLDEFVSAPVVDNPKNVVEMLVKASSEEKTDGGGAFLSRAELKGNAFVMIFAGHETTSNALAYAFALLALHPEFQEKLHQEIVKVLGSEMREPEYSDLSKLSYVLAVMNETLRQFPPVNVMTKTTASQTVTVGPAVLPPNTLLSISIPALHHHPDIWGPTAYEFNPERFIDRESTLGFIPFSEGARACPGKRFAQVEFITLLTMTSIRYKWSAPPNLTKEELYNNVEILMTTKPNFPIELTFSRR